LVKLLKITDKENILKVTKGKKDILHSGEHGTNNDFLETSKAKRQ
jgi:hypothetical protein